MARFEQPQAPKWVVRSIPLLVVAGIILVLLLVTGGSILETNQAGFYQVKQAAISGNMSVRYDPGVYWQNFGSIHTYQQAHTHSFSADPKFGEQGVDESLPTTFKDGARAPGVFVPYFTIGGNAGAGGTTGGADMMTFLGTEAAFNLAEKIGVNMDFGKTQ